MNLTGKFFLQNVKSTKLTSRRSIFSTCFIQIDKFKEKNREILAGVSNVEKTKKKFMDQLKYRSSYTVMIQDIAKLAAMCSNESESEFMRKQVIDFRKEKRHEKFHEYSLIVYYSMCSVTKDFKAARKMKADCLEGKLSRLIYLMQLYDSDLHQEVVELFEEIKVPNANDCCVAIASLYKIGTDEAFEKAMKMRLEYSFVRGRAMSILGLFACQKGEYGIALDCLEDLPTDKMSIKEPFVKAFNLRMHILTQADRFEDAIDDLDITFTNIEEKYTLGIAKGTWERLVKNTSSSEILDELKKQVGRKIILHDVTLEKVLLEPITKQAAYNAYTRRSFLPPSL